MGTSSLRHPLSALPTPALGNAHRARELRVRRLCRGSLPLRLSSFEDLASGGSTVHRASSRSGWCDLPCGGAHVLAARGHAGAGGPRRFSPSLSPLLLPAFRKRGSGPAFLFGAGDSRLVTFQQFDDAVPASDFRGMGAHRAAHFGSRDWQGPRAWARRFSRELGACFRRNRMELGDGGVRAFS